MTINKNKNIFHYNNNQKLYTQSGGSSELSFKIYIKIYIRLFLYIQYKLNLKFNKNIYDSNNNIHNIMELYKEDHYKESELFSTDFFLIEPLFNSLCNKEKDLDTDKICKAYYNTFIKQQKNTSEDIENFNNAIINYFKSLDKHEINKCIDNFLNSQQTITNFKELITCINKINSLKPKLDPTNKEENSAENAAKRAAETAAKRAAETAAAGK